MISWDNRELEENGIKEIDTIEFLLIACDYEDLFGGDLVKESVVLKP